MRIDFRWNGVDYFNYELVSGSEVHTLKSRNINYVTNIEHILPGSTVTGLIPKGSKICISPGCTYVAEDIRKNYTVKRGYDNGDYNVLSESNQKYYDIYANKTLICPNEKTIYITGSYPTESVFKLRENNGYVTNAGNEIYISDSRYLKGYAVSDMFFAALNGTLVKPLAYPEHLDLASEEDIPVSALLLAYNAGKVALNKTWDNYNDFVAELKALNVYNWRKFPMAMSMLFSMLRKRGYVGNFVLSRSSLRGKVINEMVLGSRKSWHNPSEADLKLTQEFISEVLNIKDGMVVTFDSLVKKINDAYLSTFELQRVFDVVVRIKPKKIDENNDTV